MRQADEIGIKICEYQAGLFELSASYLQCSSLVFIKQFMSSDIANRMDKGSFIFEALDTPACLDELGKERKLTRGKEKYPTYVLSWIGYMYRYIAYTREISSAFLFSKVKPKQLYAVYEAYHSMDTESAAVRILEAAELNANNPIDYMAIARRVLL